MPGTILGGTRRAARDNEKNGGESKMKVLVQAFAVVADSVDLSVLGK